MVHINGRSLAEIAERVPVPGYDRSQLRGGIVHIGVGSFHRAHQAMYLDRLFNAGQGLEWGIVGVGLLPRDREMRDLMSRQDCLYTLVVKHPDGSIEPRVIGSIVDYLFAPDDPEKVLDVMTDAATRVVSLTITEGGYRVHAASGEFDADDPQVQADLRPGATPTTAFGFVTEALARRRQQGKPPFVVMSCDNLQGNGHVARRMLAAFAALRDPDLGAWMQENVAFPNAMVDRITPVTTDRDRQQLLEDFGIDDGWPVVCEPFTQWALEDCFPLGRPRLEDVAVQLVPDVVPYELMKLRLLNASHQALCYLGYLAGYRYVHEVCSDPLFTGFLLGYMDEEATPTLQPVPGVDLERYKHELIERFANAAVRDTVARLCAESSDRIPKWLVPLVHDQLAGAGHVRRSALVIAAWARYAEGIDEHGNPIEVVDTRRDAVMARARRQRQDPLAFLREPELFGDLVGHQNFVRHYLEALESLHTRGARATLEDWERVEQSRAPG